MLYNDISWFICFDGFERSRNIADVGFNVI